MNKETTFHVPYIFSSLNLKTNIGVLTSKGNKVNFFTNTWYTALSTDYMPHEDYFTAVIILTFVLNKKKHIEASALHTFIQELPVYEI